MPTRASTASPTRPRSATGCPTASVHNISRYRDRRCERAGRHGAVDDDLPVGRDVAPGGQRLDEQKRREREEDDEARGCGRSQLAKARHGASASPPLDDHERERDGQKHAVVVRRERDAAGRAREERVALPRTVRARAGPHARHRQVRQDDGQRRRDIVLHVVGVADVQRGDGQEDRRRERRFDDRSGAAANP